MILFVKAFVYSRAFFARCDSSFFRSLIVYWIKDFLLLPIVEIIDYLRITASSKMPGFHQYPFPSSTIMFLLKAGCLHVNWHSIPLLNYNALAN